MTVEAQFGISKGGYRGAPILEEIKADVEKRMSLSENPPNVKDTLSIPNGHAFGENIIPNSFDISFNLCSEEDCKGAISIIKAMMYEFVKRNKIKQQK